LSEDDRSASKLRTQSVPVCTESNAAQRCWAQDCWDSTSWRTAVVVM